MNKLIAAIALAVMTTATASAQTTLTIATVSYHGDRSDDWNEVNPGVGIEHNGFVGGYYRNSYDKDTVYAGYAWRPVKYGVFKAGITVAAATGYESSVVAIPSFVIEGGGFGVELIAAPALGKNTTWFVGLNLRVSMGK